MIHPLAGLPPSPDMLVNISRLVTDYYTLRPDPENPSQAVSFGTSGHRGASSRCTFNESHIAAIVQAICEYRHQAGIGGPLFLGMDTHALSEPAFVTAVEVLAANGVTVMVQAGRGYTPTPVISHAILTWNRGHTEGLSDGIVITPSHNPPSDGGIKYNPPDGGPADTEITRWMQNRANEIICHGGKAVKRVPFDRAWKADTTIQHDYMSVYIPDLIHVIDMEAIKGANLKVAADALGGSGLAYWPRISEYYGLNFDFYNIEPDPTFRFMNVDRDGKIRMDCSSPYAIAGLLKHKDTYDIAFGNDPDFDRHGIVTPDGLMNPNHYLSVAIQYLFTHRPHWSTNAKVGKTLVSSSMIDRVVKMIGRELAEVPVGFKWFVKGLADGTFGFGGEESAGASFLRENGTVWTTDKDGMIMGLLAAEITAVTGESPSRHYRKLTEKLGNPVYTRIDAPATRAQKSALADLSPEKVTAGTLGGEKITGKLTHAPYNGAALGGLKVVTENGWFAARPSGTEDIYKIYAESFLGDAHLAKILEEAQNIVTEAVK